MSDLKILDWIDPDESERITIEDIQAASTEAAERVEELEVQLAAERERVERLREALTPSEETKAAYIGEFPVFLVDVADDGLEYTRTLDVPWGTIKQIMEAVRRRAHEH